MTELTSRQRMLRALAMQEPDHMPCCFMSFTALRKRHQENMYELANAERAMGLDSMLFIPIAPRPERLDHPDLRGLPVRFHPDVKIKEWRESDLLYKEYDTPGGKDFAETKRKLMKVSSRRLAWRGTVLLETGKPEAAAPQFKAALVTDPGNAEAMKGLALCHEALGKKDEARKCWGAYIKTGPEEEDLKLAREHLEKLKE